MGEFQLMDDPESVRAHVKMREEAFKEDSVGMGMLLRYATLLERLEATKPLLCPWCYPKVEGEWL